MPVAPWSFSAGINTLISLFATTVSTAYAVLAVQLRHGRRLQRREEVDHGLEVGLLDVQLHEHAAARFERAGEQRLELLHRLALLGVRVRGRVGDELGVGDEDRVEHAQPRGAQRATGLGDVDDGVGDLGDLRLGGAVRQRDLGLHAVLLEEAARQLRILGVDAHAVGEILHRLPRAVARHREHDARRPSRRLRVVQLGERRDVGAGLLDPVARGDAEVEEPVGDVPRDLLRPQDHDFADTRVVDRGAVVDVGGPHDREIGILEQLQRRPFERTLRHHDA